MERRSISYKEWLIFFSLLADILLVNIAAVLAFCIRFKGPPPAFNFSAYLNLAPYMTVTLCLLYYVFDLYDTKRMHTHADVIFNVIKASSLGFVVLISFTFFYRQFSFPRFVLIIFYFLNILFTGFWHMMLMGINNYLHYLFVERRAKRRILIVGAGAEGQRAASIIYRQFHRMINIVGFIDDNQEQKMKIPNFYILGKFRDLKDIIIDKDVDEVIFSSQALTPRRIIELLETCVEVDVRFLVIPELLDVVMQKPSYHYEYGMYLVDLTIEPIKGWQANLKKMLDIICSVMGFLCMVLFIPVIVIVNRFTSPGPLFYRQERLGRDGRSFFLLKFRTMPQDAEEKTGPVWASKNDSRIPKFGNFLRRTHIDELPQVINILKGEMSVVGPRPERPEFARPFLDTVPFYKNRLLIAPGLTGWAQVNQVADESIEDVKRKLQYDLFYIENMSVFFDMKIIARTLPTLFRHTVCK